MQLLDTLELLASGLEPVVKLLLVVFPLFTWIGVTFLLLLIKHHGAVAASAANVVRKIIAVVVRACCRPLRCRGWCCG